MVAKEFISEIANYKEISLGSREREFLQLIALNESHSSYDIFSYLRDNNEKDKKESYSIMAYKNVHKRIKRLEVLDLIEKIEQELQHRAIKYRLTARGLFQCLLENLAYDCLFSDKGYNENIIMQTILYQFFELETIKKFLIRPRMNLLNQYLRNCSQVLLEKVKEYQLLGVKEKYKEEWLPRDIDKVIESEIRKFVFEIVTMSKFEKIYIQRGDELEGYNMQEYIKLGYPEEWGCPKEIGDPNYLKLFPIKALMNDQNFIKLLKKIRTDFDDGYKEFVYD